MHPQIPFFVVLSLSVWQFQIPLEGISCVKMLADLELFMQQTQLYKICLRLFSSVDSPLILLIASLCMPYWIMCTIFFKIRAVFHMLCLWNNISGLIFFAFLTQVTRYLPVVKTKKQLCRLENFLANILNSTKCKEWVDRVFIAVCLWHVGSIF